MTAGNVPFAAMRLRQQDLETNLPDGLDDSPRSAYVSPHGPNGREGAMTRKVAAATVAGAAARTLLAVCTSGGTKNSGSAAPSSSSTGGGGGGSAPKGGVVTISNAQGQTWPCGFNPYN